MKYPEKKSIPYLDSNIINAKNILISGSEVLTKTAFSITGALTNENIVNYLQFSINNQIYYVPMYTGTFTAI